MEESKEYDGFALDIEAYAIKLGLATSTMLRRMAISLHQKIILRTPVDKGRARASWGVSIGEPGDYEAPATTNMSDNQAAQAGFAQIEAIKGQLLTGKAIWIFNNLPYIEALEYGHSDQAPNGMVRLSVAEIEAEMISLEVQD